MYRSGRHPRGGSRIGRGVAILLLLLALAATVLTGPAVRTQAQPPPDAGQVDAVVQNLMALYDVPGVAIGLIKDGKVILTKGYGVRDVQTGQPVTENTLFAIGSITKSFTALDIAQLVDAGKLNLDTPVVTYLPDFKLSDPASTRQVTLRHLLSHTSGVAPFDEEWYHQPGKTREQVVADMATAKITAPPGKLWQYTNQNFVVAGSVLERVTGQSWEDYTRDHVFAPLGMQSANFTTADSQKAADYASPHALDVLKGMQPIPFYGDLSPIGPAGSINANVRDMAQYALFQMGDGVVPGNADTRLVSQDQLTTMHTAQIAIGGSAAIPDQPGVQPSEPTTQTTSTAAPLPDNVGYGLGWMTEDYHGAQLVLHNGAIDGFYAYVTLVPAKGDGVVLLTNAQAQNGAALFGEAARMQLVNWLLGVPSEPNLTDTINQASGIDPVQFEANLAAARTYHADPAALAALTGDYPGVRGTLHVATRASKLYVKFEGDPVEVELVPFGPGDFLLNVRPVAGTVIRFQTDAQGTITVTQAGVQIAQRLGPGVQAPEYKDPHGRFTITIPQGLAVQQQGEVVTFVSTTPPGVFLVTARDAGNNTLAANVHAFLQTLDPTFKQTPVNVSDLPAINGVIWTQLEYTLPGDQVLAVLATQQNGTTYLVLLQAKQADLAALSPMFQSMLLGYKITASGPATPPVTAPTPVPGMPRTGDPAGPGTFAAPTGLLVLAILLLGIGRALRRRPAGAGAR